MASLELRDIRKTYDRQEAVKGVSLSIADGEFIVFVGPSGCGKSTLLRMVAGLEEITAGEVLIGGRVVNDVAPKDRDIAMVFQNYALYPHMTVAQNMSFALKLRGVQVEEIRQRVQKAAETLGLQAYLERYPRQLSGGQRQRVAMGRALVRDPQIFLFDEPLSNLDAKLRVQMRTEIKELHQKFGTTMIYVTHDQIEAMTMADRIVILRDGVVEQVGTPMELYDYPASLFVAGFIGAPAMNCVNGRLQDGRFVSMSGVEWPLPPGEARARAGDAVYGIRPENLYPDPDGIPFEVVMIEPTGAETQIVVRKGSDEITYTSRDRALPRRGDIVHLRADPERTHLFDPATGERL